MPQHYRYRSMEVVSDYAGLTYPVKVIERIGTGLGLYWMEEDSTGAPGGYRLVHLASGYSLTALTVPSLVQAGRWLKQVCALADWTQPALAFKKQRKLHRKVLVAYKAVCTPTCAPLS
jgi:hypothetical protein